MGMVMEIGAVSRESAVAPVQLLLDVLRASANTHDVCRLSILTDATVPGGIFEDFDGSPEQLIHEFAISDILGIEIGIVRYCFICVWPPKCFGSANGAWSIIGETDKSWDETLLDQIIGLPGIEYAAITAGDTLDLDHLDHVNASNFPWDHYLLIAARTRA